jgi:hypothetical protein
MNLDKDLKRALRRESPPPGFAGRVLDRVGAEDRQVRPSWRWWKAAAASFTLAALLGGYATYTVAEQRREEAEKAKEQVLLALSIAGEKVRYAQKEVRAIGTQE